MSKTLKIELQILTMKNRFFSSLAVTLTVIFCALSFTTAKAQAGCKYTCTMTDSWGDGWNGATSVLVQRTGLPDTLLTGPANGVSETVSFLAYQGSTVTFSGIGGAFSDYSYEADISITDPQGNALGSFNGSSWTASPGVVFLTESSSNSTCLPPSCTAPTTLLITGITSTTTDFSWTDPNTTQANNYEIEIGAPGFTPGTGAGTVISSTSTNPGLSGLTPQTAYDVYVRAICSATETSAWSVVSSFSTIGVCPDINATLCYSNSSLNTLVYEAANPGDYITVTFNSGEVENNYDELYVIDGDLSTGTLLYIDYGASGDVSGLTFEATSGLLTFGVQADGSSDCSGGAQTTIDYSITCSAPPACVDVTGLTATATSSNSVELSFTDANATPAAAFIVTYDDGNGAVTVSPNPTASPVTISGLSGNTTYTFTVQADCGTDVSPSPSTVSITTPCDPYTLPYNEDFSTFPNPMSLVTPIGCWTQTWSDAGNGMIWFTNTGGTTSSGTGPNGTGQGTYMYLETTNGVQGDVATISFDATLGSATDYRMIYSYHMYGASMGTLSVLVDDGTGATVVSSIVGQQQTSGAAAWRQDTIDLSAYAGQTITVSFQGNKGSSYQGDMAIDDVVIEETPPCGEFVGNLAASNVTASSVDLAWTDNNAATEWEIEYGATGFTPGTGAGTSVTVTSNPYTLSGLAGNTSYDVYVRANCSATEQSAWSAVESIVTLCNVFPISYSEDFSSFMPSCWTEYADGEPSTGPTGAAGSGSWTADGFMNNGTSGAAKINIYGTSTGDNDWLVSPEIDLGTSTTRVRFDFGVTAFGSSAAGSLPAGDEVIVLITDDAGASWDTLVIYDSNTSIGAAGNSESIVLTGYANTVQFAFWANRGAATGDNDVFVDNFVVDLQPNCLEPSGVTAANITASSADVTWTDANTPASALFTVSYGPAGFTAGSGTEQTVNTTSYALTGLSAETAYDVYVRADCGIASGWSIVESFTTLPSCYVPTAVTVSNVLGTSADVSWTANANNSSPSYEVEYGLSGFAQGSGTVVTSSTTSVSLSGLTTATSYDVYVRAVCAVGDESQWTSVANFTTFAECPATNAILCYSNGSLNLQQYVPATAGDYITLTINSGRVENSYDEFFVYDGDLATGTQLYFGYGTSGDLTGLTFEAQSGLLTFGVQADGSVDCSTGSQTPIDYNVSCSAPPSCQDVQSLSATATSPNDVEVSFTDVNASAPANGYIVTYDDGSGAVTVSPNPTASPVTISGLTANTTYSITVQADCGGGDLSPTAVSVSVTTPCDVISSYPWTEDFEAASPTLNCWSSIANVNVYGWQYFNGNASGSVTAYSGSQNALFFAGTFSATDADLVSPVLDLSGLTSPQLVFQHTQTDWSGDLDVLSVYYSTDGGSTFTLLDSYTSPVYSWTERILSLPVSSSLQVYFNAVGAYGYGITIDDVVVREAPSCQDVTSLAAVATSGSAVEVSFVDPNTVAPANGYVVTYDDGNGAQTVSPNPTASPFTISGLTPASSYTITVQADCGSAQANAVSTTVDMPTECPVTNATYCYANSTTAWENISVATPGDYITITFNSGSVENSYDELLVYDGANGTGTQLYFGYGSFGDVSGLSFESTTGVISFAVQADGSNDCSTGGQTTIDYSVTCAAPPSCFPVSAVTIANITGTSADVTWTPNANNSSPSYEIEYGVSGFTQGSGTVVTSTTASVSLTGLTEVTSYDVYVRAVCGPGDESTWTSIQSFTTACPASFAVPYSEDFTPATSTVSCWSVSASGAYQWFTNTGATGSTGTGPNGAGQGTYLYTEASSGSSGDIASLISPSITLGSASAYRLTYNYHMYGFDIGQLEVIVNDGTTSTTVETIVGQQQTSSADAWLGSVVDLSAYAGQTITVTFQGTRGGGFAGDIAIDDVVVEETPTCLPVTDVTFSNIGTTSVDVTLVDAQATSVQWSVDYGVGNTTDANERFTSLSGSLTGLTPNTTYDLVVTTTCDGNVTSSVSATYQFTTACAAQSVPYTQDFSSFLPDNCWDAALAGTPATGPSSLGSTYWRPYQSNTYRYNSYTSGRNDWILTPSFDLGTSAYQAEFDFGVFGWNSATPATCGSDDAFSFLISTDAGATWSSLFTADASFTTPSGGTRQIIDLSSYSGEVQFAFYATDGSVDDPQDVDFEFDNFAIASFVTCNAPSGVSAAAVTNSDANILFTDNNSPAASSYEVEYGVSGFTQGSGTVVAGASAPISISGLSAGTTYDVYVRAICGPGDESAWSSVESFTTPNECPVTNATYCYGNSSFAIETIYATPGDYITITFNSGSVESSYDELIVFDGAAGGGTELYNGYGAGGDVSGLSFTSTTGVISFGVQGDVSNSCVSGGQTTIDYSVVCSAPPSCQDVVSLSAVGTSGSTVEVSFTDLNTPAPANGYIVTYDDGNGAQTLSPNPTASPFTISGLTAATSYTITVQADCGSAQANAVSTTVSTPCNALTSFPYTEDFTTGNASLNCWTIINQGGSNAWEFSFGEATISFDNVAHDDYLISPQWNVQANTSDRISFDASNYSSFLPEQFDVLLSTAGTSPSDFTNVIASNVTPSTAGDNYVYDLSAYAGQDVYVAFYISTTDLYYVYIDNFVIDGIPSCQDVTALSASATSSTSLEVSFTDNNATAPANGYIVTYDDGNGAQTMSPNPTASPFTISGLTAGTSYTITVQADCGSAQSPNAVSTTASTACDAITAFPYTEDFTTGNASLNCWTIINQGAANAWNFSGGEATISYNLSAHDDYLISPQWNVQASVSDQISFDARNRSSLYIEEFDVLLSTTGTSPSDFTNVIASNVAPSVAGDSYVYDLSAYAGQDVYVAFYIATANEYQVYIDNFVIDGTPSCLAPTALAASGVTASSVDLSWTDVNSATEWEIEYGASGFAPGTGAGTSVTVTANPYTLSGLSAETSYDVYVRANCSATDVSDWSGVASFATPCAEIVPAYSTDFPTYLPSSCWNVGYGTLAQGPAQPASFWTNGTFPGGSSAATLNIYGPSFGNTINDWLLTPTFDLSSGSWEANFDVGIFSWNTTSPDFLDSDDVFGLYASEDGGATWTAIWSADDTYVTAPGGNNETVDLSAFTGSVQFAFYGASSAPGADNDVYVDNFAIQVANSNFTWSGANNTDWSDNANWANGTAPSATTDVVIVPSAVNQPVITGARTVGDLTMADNATITIDASGSLDVAGNVDLGVNSGIQGDGSVALTGSNSGSTITINGSSSIENLVIESDYTLSSGILNITGGLTLNGGDFTGGINVVLNSDANGTAYLDDFSGAGGAYNGQITCQLYVPGTTGIQHLISSPVNTPNLSELDDDLSGYGAGLTGTNGVAVTPTATCDPNALDPSSNYGNMFEWSASTAQNIACPQQGGWIVRSAGDMDNARGYSAYLTGAGATLDMSGTPNSGDVTINMAALAITNNTAMSNWDILGNPYPSGLERNALISGNQIPAPGSPSGSFGLNSISYWNPSGTYSGTYSPYLPGDVIASFQGFSANWDAGGTNPTITYSNSMRSTETGTWRTGWYNERIDVELRGNGFADRTIILFADDATNGFDAMYDAEKFASASGQPTLYTGSTKQYALNSLAADAYGQSIPMGVIAGADGYFEFDFSSVENLPNGSMLYLEDLATGTWTNVSENPVYGFNMLATDASDRFILHFTPEVTATGVDGTCEDANAYIELSFDGFQIAGQDVAWNYAVSKEGMAQAQGSMVSTIAIPVSESGVYNVDFTFGNATVNEVLSINVPVAPTAAIPAEVALSENEAITLNGMFTNANSYEWAVDGEVFSTEANPTWTASTEGIYNIEVIVRSEDGCSASDNMVAEVSKSVTSINDVNAVFQITQDAYSVVVLTDAEGFMIEMIAMDGKLVASARASQGANVLSTQALAAGVYEVRLSSANGVVGSQKVLVK